MPLTRTAIVAGGGAGLGRAIALRLSVITLADGRIDGMQICENGTSDPPRLKAMLSKTMHDQQGSEPSPTSPEPEAA